jgi:hypothetical protein
MRTLNRNDMLYRVLFIGCFLFFIITGNSQEYWIEDHFEDFIDGEFDDAGANMYVSGKGFIKPINHWDVNNDGAIDILSVNSHPLIEMLDMSIYWGNGKDYSLKNHSYVPANGPMWVTPDDLNMDGEMDLVVANYSNGTWTEMESFIYYGGLDKEDPVDEGEWGFYPFKRRALLPSSSAQKAITGDFNNDGSKDIVIAFSGGFWEYRDKNQDGTSPSRIYWGKNGEFDPDQYSNVATVGATDVVAGDLNNDGFQDLVFANGDGEHSFVYLNNGSGFDNVLPQKLMTRKAHAVELGDLNNDGLTDIVFACQKGSLSYAYMNSESGFEEKLEFETHTAKDVVIADFNRDGFTDVFFTNHQHSLTGNPNLANRLIDSYLYYGSKDGFVVDKRQSLQTIGAWGANATDLNNDGWVDLLVCNFQEHYSYEVPSFIYWNGPEGFSTTLRTPLYEHGAQGNAVADLNKDGFPDIIITSMMGNSRGDYDDSFLYFGQQDGSFDPDDKINLPGREAYEKAFADLDDDGDVDILMVNRGEVTRIENEVWIYWNEEDTFDTWSHSGLPSFNGIGVQVCDLDKDGYLDVIVSNGMPIIDPERTPEGSYIYWGSEQGLAVTDRTEMPTKLTRSVTPADINQDGHLDLVFGNQFKGGLATIYYGDGTRNYAGAATLELSGSEGTGLPGIADLNKDGLLDAAFAHNKGVKIYYQQENGKFSDMQSVGVQAKTMSISDVNGDGWLDLICPLYKKGGYRSGNSTVLLGGTGGYSLENKLEFFTDGATGALAADFNRDGYNDVFFYCHREDGSFDEIRKYGDHNTNSLLYWGGENGFDEQNVLKIPSVGVHYDMGTDIGNIYDRNPDYTYTSSAYFSKNKKPVEISWKGNVAFDGDIKLQIRTAKSREDLENMPWMGSEGRDSYFTGKAEKIGDSFGEWIQYRVHFSRGNGAGQVFLDQVKISFK